MKVLKGSKGSNDEQDRGILDSPGHSQSDVISMKSGLSAFTHKKVMKQQKKLD